VVTETHAAEGDGENDETDELKGFTSNFVDEEEGSPESRDKTSDGNDEVADGKVVESLVTNVLRSSGRDSSVTEGR
jgi:hypothetical protein